MSERRQCFVRAVYELTAVVALVREELDGSPGASTPAPPEPEGHLVAHVRVSTRS